MEEILFDLVSIPTVTGNYEANDQALDYIANFLSARNMVIQQYDVNGYQSLVASTRRDNHKTPTVMFAAHVDVVPGKEELFKLTVDGDKLSGRGVFDMKYAIAAYLQLVDDLNGHLPKYDFGIMITSDEEHGGFSGTRELFYNKGYKPKIVVLPDAGDSPNSWKFERSAKGIDIVDIIATGENAHGSRPWKGDNAIEKLIELLDEIKELFKGQGPKTNTLNIGIIEGGEKYNQVPASARATLDMRFLNDGERIKVRDKIELICKKHDAVAVNVVPYGNAFISDLKNPYIAKFIECLKSELKDDKLTIADSHGSSDARFFPPLNIPCIITNPPGDGYHANGEWISKHGLHQFKKALRWYLEDVARESKGSTKNPLVSDKSDEVTKLTKGN